MAHVLTMVDASVCEDTTDVAAMARQLGLPVQEKRYAAPNSIERDFKPLSADESLVWRAFCPTAYREGVQNGGGDFISGTHPWIIERTRNLSGYQHDTIPAAVLRHWLDIKNRYAFDTFEVRTTERTPAFSDPLLLGYFSGAVYLLARWGLESPEALPLREVAKRIKDQRERDCGVYKFLWDVRKNYEECPVWQAASRLA